MTTTAGHSFYIGPIVFFYNQVNDTGSWEPLVLKYIFLYEPYDGQNSTHSSKRYGKDKNIENKFLIICRYLNFVKSRGYFYRK
jgi:hypothetical protein